MSDATPSLPDVLLSALSAAAQEIHTGIPARVDRYDATRQLVDVVPLVGRPFELDGERDVEYYGVITNVPVIFPGAGGFRLTFPVERGDTVALVGMEASIDKWKHLGGRVDPLDDRRHHLSDVVAVLGLRDIPRALESAPTDCATIGHDNGAVIELRQADIRIGGGAGHQPTLKGTTYRSAEDTLLTALATYATAIAAIADPSGSATTALTGAITAFQTAAATYLTTIAKVR